MPNGHGRNKGRAGAPENVDSPSPMDGLYGAHGSGITARSGQLESVLGKKLGQNLFQNCRGIDDRPLAYEQVGLGTAFV